MFYILAQRYAQTIYAYALKILHLCLTETEMTSLTSQQQAPGTYCPYAHAVGRTLC